MRETVLKLALDVATGLVRVSACFHGGVASQGTDLLLNLALDLMAHPLGMDLGAGGSRGGIGLALLSSTCGGHVGVTGLLADGLLDASRVGAGSVGELFTEVGHDCGWVVCVWLKKRCVCVVLCCVVLCCVVEETSWLMMRKEVKQRSPFYMFFFLLLGI